MGLSFAVSPEVLIPRQDTESLVEETLSVLKDGDLILDMCTGSGCILISLLHEKKTCQGIGVDVAATSIALARENAVHNQVEAEWLVSDLFTEVKGEFDVIVSNPPYIATRDLEELMPEVIAMSQSGHWTVTRMACIFIARSLNRHRFISNRAAGFCSRSATIRARASRICWRRQAFVTSPS